MCTGTTLRGGPRRLLRWRGLGLGELRHRCIRKAYCRGRARGLRSERRRPRQKHRSPEQRYTDGTRICAHRFTNFPISSISNSVRVRCSQSASNSILNSERRRGDFFAKSPFWEDMPRLPTRFFVVRRISPSHWMKRGAPDRLKRENGQISCKKSNQRSGRGSHLSCGKVDEAALRVGRYESYSQAVAHIMAAAAAQ